MAWYKTGTVAVTNNSTLVTGAGTTWAVSAAAGDLFTLDGTKVYEIDSVNSNTSLTLAKPWSGSTLTGQAYAVARLSTVAISTVTLANQVSTLLTDWQTRENEYRAWLAGDPLDGYRSDGSPANPAGNDPLAGYYPLTDLTDQVVYAACPAKLAPTAGPVFSGVATIQAGTAADPALAVGPANNAGIYSPATNTIGFAGGGSKLLTVGLETGIPVARFAGYPFIMGSETDASDKRAYVVSQQYTSAAEPEGFFVIGGYGYNGGNQVAIGGLASAYNAATAITFSTAANTTTRTGAERGRVSPTGNLLWGLTQEVAVPKLQVGFGNPAASPAYSANVDVAVFSTPGAGVLHVQGPTSAGFGFSSNTVRSNGYIGYAHDTNIMEFRANQLACMWLGAGGVLALGSQAPATDVFSVIKTMGISNSAGIRSIVTQSVGDTVVSNTFGADLRSYSSHTSSSISYQYGVRSIARASGAGGSVANLVGFYAQVDAPSGTPIVTNAIGLWVNDIVIPGTTLVAGLQTQITAGTGKWNIYAAGSAANYFAGNALFGSAVQTTGAERVQITSSALALSVRADTADTARLWRPISSASAAAGRLLFGAWNASSAQADYASIGAAIEANTAGAHAGALLFNVAAAGTIAEQMRLTSAGRLILGLTADPGYTSRLHVEGGISLNNIANGNPRVFDYYLFGSFTATATGMTTSPTGTVKYTRSGNIVVLELPSISGTSNATTFTLTGLPTQLRPAATKVVYVRVQDNGGAYRQAVMAIDSAGGVQLYNGLTTADLFTATGTKAVGALSVSYTLQ